MPEASAIGVKVGLEVFKKVAPTGISWLKTRLFGKTMLVVGERRAGKSCFVLYLEHGVLIPAGEETPKTLQERNTRAFNLAIGRDKSLTVNVKRATDTRGHDSPKEQAKLVFDKAPNILMIFLDVSRNWASNDDDYGTQYLSAMLEELNSLCSNSNRLKNKLQHVCVILNKADVVKETQLKSQTTKIKRVINSFKSPSWGGSSSDIATYNCVCVENEEGSSRIDAVIKSIMISLLMKSQT
ncbi:hypothetical protein MKK70_00200 [Methylobacterium sp. E-041]|uniref:hypothetical protein n=1 Tax=Methylobacterium sp. E-041 TaxID=2836573 RepID=UPI001FBB23E3|nr:hypothetical protein [Methylobacterium sp. E-041]MCJ2103825.1 hypothetical protein [Methylobacterium sp. E-041]